MIKAVFFDLGNVILPVDGLRLAKKLTRFSPLSAEQILQTLRKELVLKEFEKGRVGPERWFKLISKDCQFKGLSYPSFVRYFNDIFTFNTQVGGLLRRLKNRYKLGLISNTNRLHTRFLIKKYKFFKDFDRMWLSHETRIRKPDPRIYKLALKQFAVKPEQSVFIDDIRQNVLGATRVGMKGILFKGFPSLTQELKKMGVQI